MASDTLGDVKSQILEALRHPEAEEGLYFRNFYHLHEEDERPAVQAEEADILDALRELVGAGKVKLDESGPEAVFTLVQKH
ncbi:MAG: hypothetical protein J0M12_06855 [Deltaproteobacteria bacterium]|nr:hypothetical protein [Deltaproteobacteria bacterium]